MNLCKKVQQQISFLKKALLESKIKKNPLLSLPLFLKLYFFILLRAILRIYSFLFAENNKYFFVLTGTQKQKIFYTTSSYCVYRKVQKQTVGFGRAALVVILIASIIGSSSLYLLMDIFHHGKSTFPSEAATDTFNPPNGTPSAKFYTISEIYNFITANTVATEGTHDFTFSDSLAGTGRTLTEIYNALASLISVDQIKKDTIYLGKTGTLVPSGGTTTTADVLSGKTFFGNSQTDWTLQSGIMPNKVGSATIITPTTADQTIAQGYYGGAAGDGKVSGDVNLVTGNIKSGVSIFGVSGNSNVVDTSDGTAGAGEVLTGKKAYAAGSAVNGAMANIGAQTITPSTSNQTITQGYHNGSGYCAGDANLIAENIKSGTSIFGVSGSLITTPLYGDNNPANVLTTAANPGTYDAATCGTAYDTSNLSVGNIKNGIAFGAGLTGDYPSSTYPLAGGAGTDAIAGNILIGLDAWNKTGAHITGTMSNNGSFGLSCGASDQAVSAGYYSGGTLTGDTDLVSGNIKSGINIFGVSGNSNVVDTSDGTAGAGEVLTGKKAYAAGSVVNGAMANNGAQTITPSTSNQTITQGYHNGSGYCAGDANLVTGNILATKTIFGVAGNLNVVNTSSGDAIAGNILINKKAWVAGSEITGSMANIGAQTITPSTSNQTITQGYHNGSGYCSGDADLVAANIASGVDIFGVSGTLLKNLKNGSAGSLVLDYGFYTQANGGVDDYNNNGTRPSDSYAKNWTDCTSSPYCGADSNADKKDDSANLVWSKWLAAGAYETWFWANNCYEPGTPQNPDGGEGGAACDANGDNACQCVKKPAGSKVGCEALGDGVWRLPSQKELMQAYIDGSWGNLSSAGNSYWSSTTLSNSTYNAWHTALNNGGTGYFAKTYAAAIKVRCVR